MSTATIGPKLVRLVRDLGKHIVMQFAGRTFGKDEYASILARELAKYDLNHADYRADIVRTFVRADLAERARHDPFKVNQETGKLDVNLFVPADFAKGIIRLGDGLHVRMADATARQWIARQLHQQRAAEASQQAATKTTMFLQTEPGVMLFENPRMKTHEAMSQIELWPDGPLAEDDTDDTDDDPLWR